MHVLTFFLFFIAAGVEFDAVDDVIDCGTEDIMLHNAALTISAWIYPLSAGEGNFACIVARRNSSSASSGLRFQLNNVNVTNGINFIVDGSSLVQRRSVSNTITMNSWQHVLVTWDGSTTGSNIHIYVNGAEVSYNTTANGSNLGNISGQANLIGNRADNSRTFDGQITELAIWNAVLSASEITLLARSRVKGIPLQIQPASLKAYWPLDEFADGATASGANSIRDLSGNGNHGTPSNSPVGRAESVLSYP